MFVCMFLLSVIICNPKSHFAFQFKGNMGLSLTLCNVSNFLNIILIVLSFV